MVSSASRTFFALGLSCIAVVLSVAQEVETIKTDTNLVTVPVIVTSVNGLYITDLTREEFKISEDGVPHEIAFFGKIAAPFHVILMLDTSASTKDTLRQLQNAAFVFIQQLHPADRVKIISFDTQVRDLNEFTSNRERSEERR